MEHTLADEMQGWLVDGIRLFLLLDRTITALDHVHPALVPENVIIDDRDQVRLVSVAPAAAPYAAPDATLTERSNVYSLGVILRELLAGRSETAPAAVALIARCTDPSPSARPTLAMLRDQHVQLGWTPFACGPYRPSFHPDATERDLVAAMRQHGDTATPAVYADWLEQQGFDTRAKFIRSEVIDHARPDDAGWRAVVSHAEIASCVKTDCPKSWAAVTVTRFDNLRDCDRCKRHVHYCTSLAEVQNQARYSTVEIAFDASLNRADAMHSLMTARAPMYVPSPHNPPPPPRSYVEGAPPRDNVLTRLFGLFRRR